jgi:hypothetical protein
MAKPSTKASISCLLAAITLGLVSSQSFPSSAGDSTRTVPPFTLSHAWIVVSPGAPERKALEKSGFVIAPTVNRHEGQGTASVTVEFLNGYLELTYPDSTVPIVPALKVGAEKFRMKSKWRETGYSPLGIVFNRTPATPDTFPFPTWKISPEWMEPGTFMQMLTPREMPRAVFLSIHPPGTPEPVNAKLAEDPVQGAMFRHKNGARRLTGIIVVAPDAEGFPPSARYIAGYGLARFEVGKEWLLDVTLDNGRQKITRDLRPDLPLLIHY